MKHIVQHVVKKPITVLMCILIVMILGVISFLRLPINLLPEMELPYMVVVTTSPGASPYVVEEQATKKVESAIMSVSGFKSLTSSSSEHFSMVMAEFSSTVNLDTAILEVNEALGMVNFDDNVNKPTVIRFNPSMMPVIGTTVTKNFDSSITDEENFSLLSMYIENNVIPELERIEGVASVSVGSADSQVEVNINTSNPYGLTRDDLIKVINGQNIEGIAGAVPVEGGIRLLRIGDAISSLDKLKNLEVYYDSTTDTFIKLLDVAEVKYVSANSNIYYKVNGEPSLSISFQKTSDANTLDVSKEINNKLSMLANEHDFEYIHVLDQSEYISESVSSVTTNLIIGGILAVIILFIFLRDLRPTIIVGIAIPLSVVVSFVLMYFSGVTLNIISLGGLALGIGMIVDNSIVVIENIYRLLREGKPKVEATIEGTVGVGMAILASTLTTISVFLPIVFIEGMTRQLLQDLALTVTFSLLGSLLIAVVLVPTMANKLLKDKSVKKGDGIVFTKLKKIVDSMLQFTLKFRIPTLIASLLLFIGFTFITITVVGFEVMPEADEGQVAIDIEMKKGTTFGVTEDYLDAISEEIMKLEDIETYFAEIGGDFMAMAFNGTQPSDQAAINIVLKGNRKSSTKENITKIQKIFDDFNFGELDNVAVEDVYNYSIKSSGGMSAGPMGTTNPIQVTVKGHDLEQMEAVSNEIVDIIKSTDGTINYDNGVKQASPEVKITINSKETLKNGITAKEVRDAITIFYIKQGINFNQENDDIIINIGGNSYVVDLPNNESSGMPVLTPEQLLSMMPVYSESDTAELMKNPQFTATPIGTVMNFGEVKEVTGFATIERDGKSRMLNITADISPEYKSSKVGKNVENAINKYINSSEFKNKYADINVTIGGDTEAVADMVTDMVTIAVIAILLVFMIMAIQFQSLIDPLIVMLTIPLAFTGGFIALLLTGVPLSMTSIMGLVVLTGVVVNNGIVMIDYINQKLTEGLELNEAIRLSVKTRLRPILMTALTTALALTTLALGIGEGSEMLQPMAITTIGGLVYATVLTLVVVPSMFSLVNKRKARKLQENKNNASY